MIGEEVDIRSYKSADAALLQSRYEELWAPSLLPDTWAKTEDVLTYVQQTGHGQCQVAMEGEELIGYYLSFDPEPPVLDAFDYRSPLREPLNAVASTIDIGYDYHLVVDPAYRGQGIGERLAAHGMDAQREKDALIATIRAGEGETPIYNLARKCGYEETGLWFDGGRTRVMARTTDAAPVRDAFTTTGERIRG